MQGRLHAQLPALPPMAQLSSRVTEGHSSYCLCKAACSARHHAAPFPYLSLPEMPEIKQELRTGSLLLGTDSGRSPHCLTIPIHTYLYIPYMLTYLLCTTQTLALLTWDPFLFSPLQNPSKPFKHCQMVIVCHANQPCTSDRSIIYYLLLLLRLTPFTFPWPQLADLSTQTGKKLP